MAKRSAQNPTTNEHEPKASAACVGCGATARERPLAELSIGVWACEACVITTLERLQHEDRETS